MGKIFSFILVFLLAFPMTACEQSKTEEETIVRAEFDFERRTVMLSSGYEMPINGLGTYSLHGDSVISEITGAHGVSSAQVILRWNLQKGVVVIPGSSNPDHIRENTEVYRFSMTEDEMERINAPDRGEKHDWY